MSSSWGFLQLRFTVLDIYLVYRIFHPVWLPELARLQLMHPLITNVSTVCHDGHGECLWKQTGLTPGEVSSHQCDEEEKPRDYRHHPETETTFPSGRPVEVWCASVMKLSALLCLLFGLLCLWWLRHSPRKAVARSLADIWGRDM